MFVKQAICALLAAATVGSASAGPVPVREIGPDPAAVAIPAAKRDSGLGELPPYREWREVWLYACPAESLDSGLGDLPPLSEWREPWLYATPTESLDSGLGELLPLSEWRDPWLHAMPAEKLDSGLGALQVGPAPAASSLASRAPGG